MVMISDDWQKLFSMGQNWDCSLNAHYIASYPYLCEASAALMKAFGAQSVPMVAHLAYGWMPTILTYNHLAIYDDLIFEIALSPVICDAASMIEKIDKSPINNSWVGLSKTLHFMNPEVFPIWDSRIARILGISDVSKKEAYLAYLHFCHHYKEAPFILEAIKNCDGWPDYEISAIRAFELLLFTASKTENRGEKRQVASPAI